MSASERFARTTEPRSAQPSPVAERLQGLAGPVRASETTAALESLSAATLTREDIRSILSAATPWYASAVEASGEEFRPVDSTIAATEAVTLACALLRSQDLTPFDLALWFSRGAPASGEQG